MCATLPATKNFRVIVNLSHFFHDHRTRARIFINENIKQISDLEDRIKGIFHLKKFHLTVQNQYLPPSESVGILQHDDVVWVMPKHFEHVGAASANSRIGEREPKIKKKRSNSDVTMVDMSPEKESQKQKKKEKLLRATTDCKIEASVKKMKCKQKSIEENSNSRNAVKTTSKKETDGSDTGKAVATDEKSSSLPTTMDENSKQSKINIIDIKHIHNTRESVKTCNKNYKESYQKLTKNQETPPNSSSSDDTISPPADQVEEESCLQPNQNKVCFKTKEEKLAVLQKWYFVPEFNEKLYTMEDLYKYVDNHPNIKLIEHIEEEEEKTKERDIPQYFKPRYSMKEVIQSLANDPNITLIEKVKEIEEEHSMDTSEVETAPNTSEVETAPNTNLELKDPEEKLQDPSNLEMACEKSMDVTQDSTSMPRRRKMACVSSVGQLLTDLRSVTPTPLDNAKSDCNEPVTKRQRKRARRRKNKNGKSSTDTSVEPSSVAVNGYAVPRRLEPISHKHYIFEEGEDGKTITIDITPYDTDPSYPGNTTSFKYDSDILRAPMMKPERWPKVGDIIAFKMLRITENFTPGVSEQIIGKVKEFDKETDEVVYEILRGLDQCNNPDDPLSEDREDRERVLMWKDLIDARLLYPQLNIT